MKLTEKGVQALRFEGKRRVVWDDGDLRFGVSVGQTSKVYVVDYTLDGRRRRMTLGKTSEISYDTAKGMAGDALTSVRKGDDPLAIRQERVAEEKRQKDRPMTVSDLWSQYLADHVDHPAPRDRKGRKPLARTTANGYRWFYETAIKPDLADEELEVLTRTRLQDFHDSFLDRPFLGNRALSLLTGMLTFAERRNLIVGNPARGIAHHEEKRRSRFLASGEIQALANALKVAEDPPKAAKARDQIKAEPWQALAAIRLLLLTGARKTEVLSMRWTNLDLERGIWNMPTSKTGARSVRLNPAAVDLLRDLDEIKGNPYVLPGRREGARFVGLQKVWERVRKAAGLEDVRIHDLRHSFASEALGAGLSLRVVQQLLGHAELRTTERYAHLEHDAVREAADRVGQILDSKLKGKKSAGVAKINSRGGETV